MRGSAPYSSCAQEEEKEEEEAPSKPLLSVLHLWRVTPSAASLHKIIRPSKEQLPIIMRATRTSRRKVVMGIWVVSGGGAITVSVYDPKAVQNLDITFLSGWWAELGLPPLKSMAISGLCGVAAYLVQGISLRIPEPDRKGRVDMAKASLQFNPGPPPPLFEFEPCHFDPSVMGQGKASAEAKKGGRGDSRVVWRGMRMFRQRAVLLACARNGPSMMIVRGWDSSMAWRMTNVVTFHEEDWKTWKEVTDQARPLTAPYFSAGTPPEETQSNSTTSASRTAPAAAAAGGEEGEEEGQDRSKPLDGDIRQLSDTSTAATGTAPAAPESDSPSTVDADQGGLSNGAGAGGASPESAATNAAERKPPVKGQFSLRNNSTNNFGGGAAPATDQAKNDRLCQAMADRVEVRFEGRRGKLALRAPRRREEGNGGGGASGGYRSFWGGVGAAGGGEGPVGLQGADEDGDDDDGGHGEGDSDGGMYGGVGGVGRVRGLGGDELGNQEKGTDGSIPRQFLSHKDMEDRVKTLDMEENRIALASGPRRPLEDPDSGMEEWLHDLPGGRSVRAYARRRGADGKLRTVEEIVEQLAINKRKEEALAAERRQEAVRKWKNLGKVLCRLLRMSDYWYGFASDGALLSNEEKASRRISVLQQIVEMRGVGRTTMKTLVRAIAERYPHSVWTRFRQLMHLPRDQRQRRDMAVCAILLGGIDNQFFKHTTAGWPFSRLVDLTSDVRLVRKPPLSVLYEEGETAPRIIGMELPQSDNNAKRAAFIHRAGAPGGSIAPRTSLATSGSSIGPGTGTAGTGFNGRSTFTGAAGRNGGGGKREEQQQQQEQQRRQEREPRWIVGAYVVMSGSVDLYVLERGPAAELPTAASQEDLAAKATRGQPMYRPRPPAEWEAADGEAEAGGSSHCLLNTGVGVVGRQPRRPSGTDHFDAALSGTGSGPRRAHTRNLAPRWKACRLGAGSLFGDRPTQRSTAARPRGTRNQSRGNGSASPRTPERSSVPALETAITAEETELLEIGIGSYRRHLAEGVRRRTHRAVAVLKATEVLDGVPAAALARICRYATERTAGQMPVDAAHPPVLNPTPRAIVARGKSKSAVPCDHESESRTDVDSGDSNGDGPSGDHGGKTGNTRSIMCRRGNFRGTVFFVAEGDGDVVLDAPDETAVVFRGGPGGGTGGGSSTESLLAAAAFGNRRARRTGRIRRRCGEENDGGSSEERPGEDHPAGPALEGAASADEQGPAARTAAPSLTSVTSVTESEQKESRRAADDPTRLKAGGNRSTGLHADDAQETVQEGSPSQIPPPSAAATSMPILFAHREPEDWDSGGDGYEGERCPRLAVLKRGDFFGVDPIRSTLAAAASSGRIGQSPSSSFSKRVLFGYSSKADDQGGASAPSSSLAATAAAAADGSVAKTRNKQACCARPGLIGVTDPLAIAADPPAVPPPTFPSLHMASLVAGPGGMRCLAVGLAVLQKICPPVHRRLERAASERYSGWMTDAKRRNEHDWHESLENESVRSLSKPFYDSYAKGNCSESVVTGTVPTDVDSSIGGWTVSVDGGWAGSVGIGGSRSVVSFDDRGDSRNRRKDGSVGQAPARGAAAAPASIVESIRSVSTFGSFESKKSIFELSRRYIGLALCSSGRGVVPVRLGRAVTEEAVPLKASPRARKNGRLARPRPSPPSPRAVSGSARRAGFARHTSGRAAAGVTMVPGVGRPRSLGPASPTHSAGSDGVGGTTCASLGGGSLSTLPKEHGLKNTLDNMSNAGSTLRLSPPPNLAGVGTAGTSSAENADDGDLDAGTSLGDGCCSRGRRCGASPTRERSAPSERLGGGAEIGFLLERYHEIERYDCPVSPFSNPPSWADTPPAATIEPPGVPPPPTNPRDCITVVEGVGGECHPAGGDLPMPLQQAEDETRKASSAERPVEKTVFQLISTRRRTSFGWGWKRPPGGKGRRRRRSELSPRERKLLSGISNLGRVYPPTS